MPSPSSPEEPWPVRTVSNLIGQWVSRLGAVWVEGQVTNLTVRGGRAFLSLRDPVAEASLSLTVAPDVHAAAESPLEEGQRLVVHARPQWGMQRGRLDLVALEIRALGLGALLARLEKLRVLLQQEGLFDPARKKPLPFLPRVVGLICGRESDARHDVVENARRRWPAVEFDVREVPVQGVYAVSSVVDALRALDREPDVEVIVIARGGGDVQELLPFSDEALLRAVAAATTPIVSAIGHEADSPLLDFVADVRASTPTDAGKRVVPDVGEEVTRITGLRRRAWRCVDARVEREVSWLHAVRSRPALAAPYADLDRRRAEARALVERARWVVASHLDAEARAVAASLAQVAALSPKATLDRGYAVVQRPDGAVLTSVSGLVDGDPLAVRLADGSLNVSVRGARPAPGTAGP